MVAIKTKNVLTKKLSEKLLKLKPFLPRGYHNNIYAIVTDVSIWQIKRAFAGKSVDTQVLNKIFTAAFQIAQEEIGKCNRGTTMLKKMKRIIGD